MENRKLQWEEPAMDVVEFDNNDVIVTSDPNIGDFEFDPNQWDIN